LLQAFDDELHGKKASTESEESAPKATKGKKKDDKGFFDKVKDVLG